MPHLGIQATYGNVDIRWYYEADVHLCIPNVVDKSAWHGISFQSAVMRAPLD